MATAPAAFRRRSCHYALAQAFRQVQGEYAWTTVLAPPLVGPATFPEFRRRELEQTVMGRGWPAWAAGRPESGATDRRVKS